MLVLSRQKDESIMIGDNVKITIVDVRGDKVRLGIDAPRTTSVHRTEVYEAIKREKAEKKEVNHEHPNIRKRKPRIEKAFGTTYKGERGGAKRKRKRI